jgi:uracil-DNA glycosylase
MSQVKICDQQPALASSWKPILGQEFSKDYMRQLKQFLVQEKKKGKAIYPKSNEIFKAFELTPLDKVKVVIIGQDPYHGPDQAHGLCFSVKQGVKTPPSLANIYKELNEDLGILPVNHGCLESWAKQGVLMLNAVLTVQMGCAASHQKQGWEIFTDKVIEILNQRENPIVFVLWGAYAQRKGQAIIAKHHCVIKSVHPSPLSAHRGFFGSHPFSKINTFLEKTGQKPIQWQLPQN